MIHGTWLYYPGVGLHGLQAYILNLLQEFQNANQHIHHWTFTSYNHLQINNALLRWGWFRDLWSPNNEPFIWGTSFLFLGFFGRQTMRLQELVFSIKLFNLSFQRTQILPCCSKQRCLIFLLNPKHICQGWSWYYIYIGRQWYINIYMYVCIQLYVNSNVYFFFKGSEFNWKNWVMHMNNKSLGQWCKSTCY